MGTNETKITKKIVTYLEKKGCFVFKIWGGPLTPKGLPDIVACYNGRFGAFEIKTLNGKVSKIQAYQLLKLSSHGAYAFVLNENNYQKIIDEFCMEEAIEV